MNLVFFLQLAKAISFYDIKFPGNAEIFLQEARKLIDFEMLKPEFLVKLYDPRLEL